MRFFLIFILILSSGCAGYEKWERVDGEMICTQKFKTWGLHHTITEGDKVNTESRMEPPFREMITVGASLN